MLELSRNLKSASIDGSLLPIDVRVLLVIAAKHLLDDTSFQPLKAVQIWLPLRIGRSTVHRSMRRLCEQGYIERGPLDQAGAVTYRLTPGISRVA